MLDVYEHESLISDSARIAALAVVTDTTARAIRAVLDGRPDILGRRTMVAVRELVDSLTTLREQSVPPGEGGTIEVFETENITSGVGRLIGEENADKPGGLGGSKLLELSKSIAIDPNGNLVIGDPIDAQVLAELLARMGRELTDRSSQIYANSHSTPR